MVMKLHPSILMPQNVTFDQLETTYVRENS